MKDGSSLKKKLVGYSAMVGAIMAVNHHTDAQVIYHDIIPDTIIGPNPEVFNLDLNNDGNVDFRFSWPQTPFGSVGLYGIIMRQGWASVLLTQYSGLYFEAIKACENISAIVSGDDSWSSYSVVAMIDSIFSFSSPWLNNGADRYAGLRIHLADGYHYGWMRMACNIGNYGNDGYMTLKDYAYQTIPDSAITTPCVNQVKEIEALDLFNAFVQNHQLILHFHQSPLPSRMILLNEIGMKINEQAITQSELVMDVSNLAAGIYFVEVTDGDRRETKKVIIQ